MKLNKWMILLMVIALFGALNIAFVACGDDDDDDDDDDDSGDDDDDSMDDDDDNDTADDDDDTADDDDDTAPGQLGGTVKDLVTSSAIPNATVELLENATGDSFDPPVVGTTNQDGYVVLDIPDAAKDNSMVAVKTSLNNYKATYQYNFINGDMDETFNAVSNTAINLMSAAAGVSADPTKGHAAGAIYWINDSDEEENIGCGTVAIAPVTGEIFYFGSLLPDPARTDTNPENSQFAMINSDPGGPYTLTATVEALESSSTLPKVVADSVNIVNIIFTTSDSATNPTPGGCTK